MQRILIEKLIEWKDDPYKKALIIRGIPQCGKTHLLKEFGEKYYKKVFYFNFEEESQLSEFFQNDNNPDKTAPRAITMMNSCR